MELMITLGELYVKTNRIDLAQKERLAVLEKCNCEKFNELKEVKIEKKIINNYF